MNKQKIKGRYLRTKIFFFSIVVTFSIVGIIFLLFQKYTKDKLNDEIERNMNHEARWIETTIEQSLDRIILQQGYMLNGVEFQKLIQQLDESTNDSITRYQSSKRLRNLLTIASDQNELIKNMTIIFQNSVYSSDNESNLYFEDINANDVKKFSNEIVKSNRLFMNTIEPKRLLIPLVRKINATEDIYLLTEIDFERYLKKLGFNKEYQIIFNEDRSQWHENDSNKLTIVKEHYFSKYHLSLIQNKQPMMHLNIPTWSILLFVGIIGVTGLIAWQTAAALTEPFKKIVSNLNNIDQSIQKAVATKNMVFYYEAEKKKMIIFLLLQILFPLITLGNLQISLAQKQYYNQRLALAQSHLQSKADILNYKMNTLKKEALNLSVLLDPNQSRHFNEALIYDFLAISTFDKFRIYADSMIPNFPKEWQYINNQLMHQLEYSKISIHTNGHNLMILVDGLDSTYMLMFAVPMTSFQSDIFNDGDTHDILDVAGETYNLTSNMLDETDVLTLRSSLNEPDWVLFSRLNPTFSKSEVNSLVIMQIVIWLIATIIVIYGSGKLRSALISGLETRLSSTNDNHLSLLERYFVNTNEIQGIIDIYQQKVDALNTSMERQIEMQQEILLTERKRNQTQLSALQHQVTPHFLYNALENLMFLVEDNQTQASLEMIVALSHFFEYITNREHDFVTIEEELNFTQKYIFIMQERFDELKVSYDIDASLLKYKILRLMIQPLVENSIHHGVQHMEGPVHIWISFWKSDGNIVIEVKDNAGGMDEVTLNEINRYFNSPTYNQSGLLNVHDRLKLFYEEDFSLKVESIHGRGTIVTIHLPLNIEYK